MKKLVDGKTITKNNSYRALMFYDQTKNLDTLNKR